MAIISRIACGLRSLPRRISPKRRRMASTAYKHPRPGGLGILSEWVANAKGIARVRRAVLSRLPFPRLSSNVRDVVYLTWLVPDDACERLIPSGVRLWQRNGLTPFSVLTYRHSHFGPSFLGPLRKL